MGYAYVLDRILAQGSKPPEGSHLYPAFDTLVLTAMEYQPPSNAFPDVHVLHVPLDDAKPTREEVRASVLAARNVAERIRRGGRVLTTCQQGRNRSGIVNGLTLMELGMSAEEAIQRIRQARGPTALSNSYFVEVLRAYEQVRHPAQPYGYAAAMKV